MYSAAVYNYFNSGRQARNVKYRKSKLPIPKPSKKMQINKCKLCGRKFMKIQNQLETDAEIKKQSGNSVFEKVLLIWKYAKNLLSNKAHGNDSQKCSFKTIAHKSYKKRSLHQEIVSTTSILPQICKICEERKIQINKCKELKAEERKINEYVNTEHKYNNKRNGKKKKIKHRKQRLIQNKSNKSKEAIPFDEGLQGKKRQELAKKGKRSLKIKNQKPKCINKTKPKDSKKVSSRKNIVKKPRKLRKACSPKKIYNTNKKKRMFLKENRKKVNRFASWHYMQHALNSVGEETITNYVNEDSTPVYLTFEEYCLILEAIDTQSSTEKLTGPSEESGVNIEEVRESVDRNIRRPNVCTEDVATNTDQPFENTEDASTNTEQLSESTEGVATNTGLVSKTTEEMNEITEQTNEITEELTGTIEEFDVNTEKLSETSETLAAINDPLSEASEEFDVNTDQPSTDIENLNINNVLLNESSEKLDENSFESSYTTEESKENNTHENENECNIADINKIDQSEEIVCTSLASSEGIAQTEEGNQSKEQTESPEDSLVITLNQQNENTCTGNQTEGDESVKN